MLSPQEYNEETSLAVVVPITRQVKGYPFEVDLPRQSKVAGAILADHLKSLDWKARNAEFAERLPHAALHGVLQKVRLLVGIR
ncbi:MAG: mRNA interferase MazF [Rhodothermales bacterium]|jgi:mRNA interferase MazF